MKKTLLNSLYVLVTLSSLFLYIFFLYLILMTIRMRLLAISRLKQNMILGIMVK